MPWWLDKFGRNDAPPQSNTTFPTTAFQRSKELDDWIFLSRSKAFLLKSFSSATLEEIPGVEVLELQLWQQPLTSPEQTATVQYTQTDCVQDTAQRMKLKRLKASTTLMTRQTDAEQRRPTIKKLEVKLVEIKLGEDCWEIQVKRAFALRNFNLEVMEFESAHSNTTARLPILKLAQENGTLVTNMSILVTAEEKTNKKNDVKARSLLLLALPNAYQLTFSPYNDAKTMFAAIKTRFGGVVIAQEDLNSKFQRSLPPEWNTHVWCSKLAFMNAPSTRSTNDVNTAKPAYEVSTVSPNDFEQIHEDDLEAMDLKWQLSLLSMRVKRYFQRTGKKIFINTNDTARYDKSKVEYFNYHKMGHFSRECRAPRNKEGQFRNQDNTRKHGNNEDTSSKAMLAIDGVGFDWSDMAEEQVQTNMALMAFSDSEVYNDKTCSKTCLKNYETLKKQCDDLIVKLNQTEFTAATYKRGLATVEEQLITYRKNEVLFSEEVAVLKREVACKDYEINVLKSEFEKVKQEKEGIEFKIEKFDKASKDLDKLLGSQITDKSKKGLGYNVVPPPHPLIYNRPKKLDLSYSGLDEFKEPEFKSYGSEDSKKESNIVCDKKIR
ncbi:hypothetical protein Tco_0891075 [Tanacetum coccineum]|uniref:Uncharacterized protein n=1 Tax=Tanacetum coccineum TaxID=301880 RepID=A0ABQ5C5A5_9ASTR